MFNSSKRIWRGCDCIVGFWAIISAISAIASLLSLFFEVDKIRISIKKFILLLSIVCFVIFTIAFISGKKNDKDNQEDNLTVNLSSELNSDDQNSKGKSGSSESETLSDTCTSESETLSDTYTGESEENHNETIEQNKETDRSEGILKIDPLIFDVYNATAIVDVFFEIQPNEIIVFLEKSLVMGSVMIMSIFRN